MTMDVGVTNLSVRSPGFSRHANEFPAEAGATNATDRPTSNSPAIIHGKFLARKGQSPAAPTSIRINCSANASISMVAVLLSTTTAKRRGRLISSIEW